MKRIKSNGKGSFARFGLRPHWVRSSGAFRGGRRL